MPWCSGWLLIAEVRSRFDPNNGGANPDKFCEAIEQLGLSLLSKVSSFSHLKLSICTDYNLTRQSEWLSLPMLSNAKLIGFQDFSNKMFVLFYFKKTVRLHLTAPLVIFHDRFNWICQYCFTGNKYQSQKH